MSYTRHTSGRTHVTSKTAYGGHNKMYGIPFIDVRLVCTRIAHSALPHAPVIEDEKRRYVRGGRRRKTDVGSPYG